MWYRNVSICFIFVYYVFIFSLNVIIGEIIDYILMRVILLWWIYNYIIKYRISIYLGVIFFNFLKLFFFGRGGGWIYIKYYNVFCWKSYFNVYVLKRKVFIYWNCLRLFFVFVFYRGDFTLILFCSCIL